MCISIILRDWRMAAARDFPRRARRTPAWSEVPALVRRVTVGVLGTTLLLFGIALLVLPGPAFVVIPLGLGLLATEFVWARRWVRKARHLIQRMKENGKVR